MKYRILLIEDEKTFYDAVSLMVEGQSIEVVWAENGAKGIQAFSQDPHGFAVVLIDYLLPDSIRGSDVCRHLQRINRDQLFLFTSKYFEPEFLMDQLRVGANGFVDKNAPPEEMRNEILRAISVYEKENRVLGFDAYEKSKAELHLAAEGIIGRSATMYRVLQETLAARASKYPTLIVGETGTGKELVARALVPEGKSLVAVNCASFRDRENLLESEFFGYVKGAFTDAKADKVGLVMQAHSNVLFLDELHQLSVSAQSKLLRFLQEMRFRRVGDSAAREIEVNFKLIAAVQPDIRERLRDGRFLPDLLERVGSLVIQVPALRDRPEDIEPLVRKFQDEFNEGKAAPDRRQIRISTITEMEKHGWPTNVRGLQNAVKRMLTNCREDVANPKDFRAYLDGSLIPNAESEGEAVVLSLEHETRRFEAQTIIKALKNSRTRVEAAARVGLPLTSFLRKLAKLEINPDLFLRQT